MMSRIGKSNRGFTLIELLVAVAVLAIGTVMIQQGLLRSADLFGRYSHALNAQIWSEEKMWQAREIILSSDGVLPDGQGSFSRDGRTFFWSLVVTPIGGGEELYSLALSVAWKEGQKSVLLSRESYVAKPSLETDLI